MRTLGSAGTISTGAASGPRCLACFSRARRSTCVVFVWCRVEGGSGVVETLSDANEQGRGVTHLSERGWVDDGSVGAPRVPPPQQQRRGGEVFAVDGQLQRRVAALRACVDVRASVRVCGVCVCACVWVCGCVGVWVCGCVGVIGIG